MEMSFERNQEGQMEHADDEDTPSAIPEEAVQDMHIISLAFELIKIISETRHLDLISQQVFERFCCVSNEMLSRPQADTSGKDAQIAGLQEQNRLLSQELYEQGLFLTKGGTA